jgi:hypothetical protein
MHHVGPKSTEMSQRFFHFVTIFENVYFSQKVAFIKEFCYLLQQKAAFLSKH